MDATSEATTVEQAASGDEVAFARLIAEHHEPMVCAAYVVVGDTELAREAAQNAWTIAWKRLGSLRQPERIRSWLVAICANEARQLIRHAKRGGDIVLQPVPELTGTTVPEGPTILARGVFHNGVYENGGWWVEGPEGATGTTVTADPVDEVEAPVSEQMVERLRIHFTAGDLPGRYVFHYGYSEDEVMVVDVTE